MINLTINFDYNPKNIALRAVDRLNEGIYRLLDGRKFTQFEGHWKEAVYDRSFKANFVAYLISLIALPLLPLTFAIKAHYDLPRCQQLKAERGEDALQNKDANIRLGEAVFKGEEIKDKTKEEQAVGLIWYLTDLAEKKAPQFKEGTFVIHDPNKVIFNFLKTMEQADLRISTHFAGVSSKHFGVNIDAGMLPRGKQHLLFGELEKDLSGFTFIKPENYGVKGTQHFLGHFHDLIFSLGRKAIPSLFGSDQAEGYYRERVPPKLQKMFVELKALSVNPKQYSGAGFRHWLKALSTMLPQESKREEFYAMRKNFQDALNKEVQDKKLDHLEHRTGEEIIIYPYT